MIDMIAKALSYLVYLGMSPQAIARYAMPIFGPLVYAMGRVDATLWRNFRVTLFGPPPR